jgi:hypothetical protein
MRVKYYQFLVVVFVSIVFAHSTAAQTPEYVSEVTLEMSPSNMGGRAFTITIRNDGTAEYHGKTGVTMLGKFVGQITKLQFDSLAEVIRSAKFAKMKSPTVSSSAFGGSQDMPMVTSALVRTSAVINGKKKTVSRPSSVKIDASDRPPGELLEIERAITDLATKVIWTKASK